MKRTIAFLLVLLFSLMAPMTAQAAGMKLDWEDNWQGYYVPYNKEIPKLVPGEARDFADMQGHWARGAVTLASARGIMAGYSNTQFGPDDPATIGQVIAVYTRLCEFMRSEIDVRPASERFTDVPANSWVAVPVAIMSNSAIEEKIGWLRSRDIWPGDSGIEYGVNWVATRKFVAQVFGQNGWVFFDLFPEKKPVGTFSDIGHLDEKTKESIAYMKAVGLTAGYPDGRFGPDDVITRAQLATIANSFYQIKEANPMYVQNYFVLD